MNAAWLGIRGPGALATLLIVAVAVSACGGSSGNSSSSESVPAATQAPATTAPATTTAAGGGAATAAAGKKVFLANCGSCHTLAAAGTSGNVGPNLDDVQPDMAKVADQVTHGGGGMPSFASQLSKSQIQAVAKYVSSTAGNGGSGSSSGSSGLP